MEKIPPHTEQRALFDDALAKAKRKLVDLVQYFEFLESRYDRLTNRIPKLSKMMESLGRLKNTTLDAIDKATAELVDLTATTDIVGTALDNEQNITIMMGGLEAASQATNTAIESAAMGEVLAKEVVLETTDFLNQNDVSTTYTLDAINQVGNTRLEELHNKALGRAKELKNKKVKKETHEKAMKAKHVLNAMDMQLEGKGKKQKKDDQVEPQRRTSTG